MARLNNRSLARIGLSFGAAALVALGTALPSLASNESGTTTVVVGTGSLSVGSNNVMFTSPSQNIQLNGSAQTPTISIDLADIIDSTGTGNGWNLSMTMTQFTDGGSHVLPPASLTLRNAPIVSLLDPSSSLITTLTNGTGLGLPRGTSFDSCTIVAPGCASVATKYIPLVSAYTTGSTPAAPFANPTGGTAGTAGSAGGMGSYNVSPLDLALNVPANTFAATYHSDATVTLAVGP